MSNVSDLTVNFWYAVKVRNKNEFRISEIFRNILKIESLVPAHKIWKRNGREKLAVRKPLLTTYVFIKADLSLLNINLFYSISGVFGMVSKAGQPAAILENEILSLQKLGASEKPVFESDYLSLKADDRVVVVDGPLKGAVGNIIKTEKERGMFVVNLELFKRALVTELELDMVAPF